LATSAKQFAPASSIGVPAKGRIDFYKDILNGFEVMPANPLVGGDRGRKADAKAE